MEATYYTAFGVVELDRVSKPVRLLSKIRSKFGQTQGGVTLDLEVFKLNRPFVLYQWFNISSFKGFSLVAHSQLPDSNCAVYQEWKPNSKWSKNGYVASLSRAGRRDGASAKLAVRAAKLLANFANDVSLGDVASACPDLLPVAGPT